MLFLTTRSVTVPSVGYVGQLPFNARGTSYALNLMKIGENATLATSF